jgi:hypothetical protein
MTVEQHLQPLLSQYLSSTQENVQVLIILTDGVWPPAQEEDIQGQLSSFWSSPLLSTRLHVRFIQICDNEDAKRRLERFSNGFT